MSYFKIFIFNLLGASLTAILCLLGTLLLAGCAEMGGVLQSAGNAGLSPKHLECERTSSTAHGHYQDFECD